MMGIPCQLASGLSVELKSRGFPEVSDSKVSASEVAVASGMAVGSGNTEPNKGIRLTSVTPTIIMITMMAWNQPTRFLDSAVALEGSHLLLKYQASSTTPKI